MQAGELDTIVVGSGLSGGWAAMGTARMGRDARCSVLDRWHQVRDAPNVFVTDGARRATTA